MAITKVKTHLKLLRQRERASRERSRERSRKSSQGSSRNRDDSRNREPQPSRRRHTVSHHERDNREGSSSPRPSRGHRRVESDVTGYDTKRVRFDRSPRKDRDHPHHGEHRDSDSDRAVQFRPPTPYLLPPPADKPQFSSPRSGNRARASTIGGLGITASPQPEREPVRTGGRRRAVTYSDASPANTEDFFERGRELERGDGSRWRARHSSRCPSDEDDCAACRRDASRRNSK